MNFEEWFNEQEGCGLRSERAWDDTCSAQLAMFHIMRNWMQAAYEAGHESREWVGLTDKEISECLVWANSREGEDSGAPTGQHAFARAVESKLKEKNT